LAILITGGTGFVGKRLCKALAQESQKIKIVSRNTENISENTIICDLSKDALSIDDLKDISTIFHLAAYTHDLSNPNKLEEKYKAINIEATVNLAKTAIEAEVKRFIFISSTKAGEANIDHKINNKYKEEKPQGIYGQTKREAEKRLLKLSKNTVMRVDIIRPALIYGPDVKGNLAQMIKAINGGWFPPLPDNKNSRSMVHVDDLIRAIILVERNIISNGDIYIVTDGQKYSSSKIYETLCKVLGKPIPKWKLPISLLRMIAAISPNFRYKINKLIGDEYYSSLNIESLGFKPKFTLSDMNEKIF